MKYRTLGSTGLSVSVVGIGTWQFGDEWGVSFTQGQVDAIFDAARETGVNLIDTAECYGDHKSEAFIGEAIKRDRERWVLATKFGHKFHGPFDRTEPRAPGDVVQQLEDSLKALQTDYVDLWQYHSWGDTQFFDEDVLAAVQKCKDQGKVRHLGNSVGSNTNVKQIDTSKAMDLEAIQIIYNRLDRAPEEASLPSCREQDLGVLVRLPLASGYLSGKYQPDAKFADNDVRSKHDDEGRRQKIEEAMRIQREEVPEGVPMAPWALAWCLQHDAVTCVIPGCKSADQARDNAAAAELEMVKDDHPQAAGVPAGV